MHKNTREEDIYRLISRHQKMRPKNMLNDFIELMQRLNNPHERLPRTIHVAGTNGKGSTISFLKSILQEGGYRVHRYTSPHLLSICERIQMDGKDIPVERLWNTLNEVVKNSAGLSLHYFDFLTAAAFMEFAREPADYLLLECGLGGKFDNTNIIQNPIATILTQIAMDHMDVLGKSLQEIAQQKAGIIKPHSPTITLPHKPEIIDLIREECDKKQSFLHIIENEYNGEMGLIGNHQKQNAALAALTASLITPLPKGIIAEGIKKAQWPGRMQKIIHKNRSIVVDIAHNPSGLQATIQTMEEMAKQPFHVIFSLRQTKDLEAFLRILANTPHRLSYVTNFETLEIHSAPKVEEICKRLHITCEFHPDLPTAIHSTPSEQILITGSVSLVSQALQLDETILV
ncbi:MAG: hypothetical protein KBB83_04775 [Alphaproteobacteria bacterium]|nr:hypothetical protein [Alphaproteobacteria bacterium]